MALVAPKDNRNDAAALLPAEVWRVLGHLAEDVRGSAGSATDHLSQFAAGKIK